MTEQPAETDEQRADREETEHDHAVGVHTHCGLTCEVDLPTEHLLNFVIAKGYPGTKGALDELLRRARVEAVQPPADGSVREQLLTAIDGTRCEPLGFESKEELLAAYDAAVLPATTDHDIDTDTGGLAATLREVLDTFAPMREVYGGPVSYYDGSADVTPAQYDGWRAVLDGALGRVADETATTETQQDGGAA